MRNGQGMGTKQACTRETPQAALDEGFGERDGDWKSNAGEFTKRQKTITNNHLLRVQGLTDAPVPPASCILM